MVTCLVARIQFHAGSLPLSPEIYHGMNEFDDEYIRAERDEGDRESEGRMVGGAGTDERKGMNI